MKSVEKNHWWEKSQFILYKSIKYYVIILLLLIYFIAHKQIFYIIKGREQNNIDLMYFCEMPHYKLIYFV